MRQYNKHEIIGEIEADIVIHGVSHKTFWIKSYKEDEKFMMEIAHEMRCRGYHTRTGYRECTPNGNERPYLVTSKEPYYEDSFDRVYCKLGFNPLWIFTIAVALYFLFILTYVIIDCYA